jgi:WD40 repeat protein
MIAILFSITALAWDGEHLYVARSGGVDVYRDGKRVGSLGDDARVVMGLAARGKRVAECGGQAGERGQVRIWEGGRLIRAIEAHQDLIYRVCWDAEGKRLFTAGGDQRIGVIDAETGAVEYLEGHTGPVLSLAAHGPVLVSGGADRTIRVWKDRKLVRTIRNHWDGVHALAFSPDGKYLASGSADQTVRVWQPEIGRLVRIIRGHEGTVLDLCWTGDALVSACSDGKIRLLSTEDATIVKVLEGHGDWVNALCPAGDRLYSGAASGPLRAWPLLRSFGR